MNILIATDKFKDSLSSLQACDAIEEGILNFLPNSKITKIPLADGGEGSLNVLEKTLQFNRIYLTVNDPLFQKMETYYGLKDNTAYIEMAAASGVQLLNKDERKPMQTTSLGTGELINDAVQKGATNIYLFVGGSATNDAGMGITQALGFHFLDDQDNKLKPIGANLSKVKKITNTGSIDFDRIKINVLTDVSNPLYGDNGAAFVYASQKGANDSEVVELDKGLRNFSNILKQNYGRDISAVPGSGAAGGVGAGLSVLCNAEIKSGINSIFNILDLEKFIKANDLIITGEGKLDKQTLEGKVVKGVMDRCKKINKPLGIICGDIDLSEEELNRLYFSMIKSLVIKGITKDEAMENSYQYLVRRAEEFIIDFTSNST